MIVLMYYLKFQENRNQNLAEIIEELRQKTEELPIWVRGEFEDLQDRGSKTFEIWFYENFIQ